jgi:hypothetical protein
LFGRLTGSNILQKATLSLPYGDGALDAKKIRMMTLKSDERVLSYTTTKSRNITM